MANIDNVQLPDGSSYNIVDNTSGFATQNYVDSAVSSVTKTTIGLGNVDNTSDLDKPVSTAQQTALDAKVNKSGDTISGNVTVNGVITLNRTTGTTTATENSDFNIGNNIPQGTVGNSRGRIVMYGTGSNYTVFQAPNSTANRTINLPNSNGTLALEPTEESGSLVSYMQSGFTGNEVNYYKKGNLITIRCNGAMPASTGAQIFLTLPASFVAKIQTFAIVADSNANILGLAYISGSNVSINVSRANLNMYFSLTYQC